MSSIPKATTSSSEDHSDHDLFMSVKELKAYVEEVEMAKAKKSLESMGRADDAKAKLLKQLRSEEPIGENLIRTFLMRVKDAAERGENELLMGRFPCEMCTDHGRAINMAEPDWPETLQGRPRQGYLIWKEKLQPLGYHLKAQIVDWPNGVPGDVGLYLSWE
ncbi:hypothetical protein [uncultured Rhodoblastus sp.]|uniref:hypothetical protein n=1 Tax=uncultured Rhodoblastus sp. TaxID=543037 RepID=UPI0025DAE3E6|nr:hypothetical protein [uncultured Rhodoblastus sp.]